MKTLKLSILAIFVSASFLSCDNSKKQEAEKNVAQFSNYVDSVSVVSTEKLKENWENVENAYTEKKLQAQSSIESLGENPELNEKLNKVNSKYDEFKAKFQIDAEKLEASNRKMNFRKTFFDGKEIGDDMNFDWVNKDNIVSVYDMFVTTASKNKDSYSREDWDEIKLMYEALDTRKNTVEKEGLTSSDNLKIAKLKLKFAPMYTLNRMGAKSEENAEAKK